MRLVGKHIVNTRAAHQSAGLDALLRAEGAIPISYPAIAIVPPDDTSALDQALVAGGYDLLVLTSANTVASLAERARALSLSLKGVQAAAVGAATAQAAREKLGVEITLTPSDGNARALAGALAIFGGMRILLPQSEIAQPLLAESLRARGAQVTAITAYRTVRGHGGVELAPLLRAGQIDAVTFTSSSTVRYFAERLNAESGATLDGVCVACLSAQISSSAREQGYAVCAEAHAPTLDALIDALAAKLI